jgi:signal transduction histidine kinase
VSRGGWRARWAGDIAFCVVLSGLSAASAAGRTGSNAGDPRAGLAAALTVLTMVTPVVLARRYPIAVATTIGAGALVNWLAIGSLVRCGTALPAVFYVAFVIGMCRLAWPRLVLGAAALTLDLVCQAYSDPQLGTAVLVYMVPITLGFGVAGSMWRHRRATVARLRVETGHLRDQRDANARMAVAADRARIATDFRTFIRDGVEQIELAAADGRSHLDHDPEQAQQAFVDIQRTGRTALTRMRDVLADLGGEPPVPEGAMLAQLDHLVAQATEGRARLRVDGDPRLLPPTLELSACRIIERLLAGQEDRASDGLEVTVGFGPQELQLTVAGVNAQQSIDRAALAVAKERVAAHGGTMQRSLHDGRRTTVVRLPLAAARV